MARPSVANWMRRLMKNVTAAVALSETAAREADEVLERRITRVLPLPALLAPALFRLIGMSVRERVYLEAQGPDGKPR